MDLQLGNSPQLINDGQKIRHQVFVIEQGIAAENDLDGLDQVSTHALLFDQGTAIATARLTPKDQQVAVLSRIAVMPSHRGQKIANTLINKLIDYAREHQFLLIKIHAHHYLQSYYEKFGFVYHTDAGHVAEHKLIEMHYHTRAC